MDVGSAPGASSDARQGSGVVLRLDGMSDIRTVKRLHQAALDALASQGDVMVDATGAAHLDTAALQVLIALRRDLAARGRTMRMSGVADGVQAFLRHAGLERAILG